MTWIDFFLPYRGFRVVTKPYTVFTLIVTFFFLFCHITRQGFQQTTSIKSVTQKGIKYNVTKITYTRYTYLHEIRKIIGLISYYNNVRKSMSLAVRKLKSACRKHCKWQETSFPGGKENLWKFTKKKIISVGKSVDLFHLLVVKKTRCSIHLGKWHRQKPRNY